MRRVRRRLVVSLLVIGPLGLQVVIVDGEPRRLLRLAHLEEQTVVDDGLVGRVGSGRVTVNIVLLGLLGKVSRAILELALERIQLLDLVLVVRELAVAG